MKKKPTKKKEDFSGNIDKQTAKEMMKLSDLQRELIESLMQTYDPERTGSAIFDTDDPRVVELEGIHEKFASMMPESKYDYKSRYGYVDRTGNVAIALKYDLAYPFSEGLAPVIYKGVPGYINHSGRMVIKLERGWRPTSFSEGLAVVQTENGCGYIDRTGRMVINPKFNNARPFSEGLAHVFLNHEVVYIDKTGRVVFKPKEENCAGGRSDEDNRFSEGLVRMRDGEKIGYMDRFGNVVIKPRFSNGAAFSEGMARVEVKDKDGNYRLCFIDRTGKIVIDTRFNTDADFERNSTDFSEGWAGLTEGLCPNVLKEEQWAFIDKTGRIALTTKFFYADKFSEGLAAVYDSKANKCGSIDKAGKLIVPLEYDAVGPCSEGLIDVRITEQVKRKARHRESAPVLKKDDEESGSVRRVTIAYHWSAGKESEK